MVGAEGINGDEYDVGRRGVSGLLSDGVSENGSQGGKKNKSAAREMNSERGDLHNSIVTANQRSSS